MNIFSNYKGFIGEISLSLSGQYSLRGFFELAGEIRQKLNSKAYLLDLYLKLVFKGLSASSAEDSAAIGSDYACQFQAIIIDALDGNVDNNHPFFETAKKFISEHPLENQEHYVRLEMYMIALMDGFIGNQSEKMLFAIKERVRPHVDEVKLQQLYEEINSHLFSVSLMDKLNFVIIQRFVCAYPIQILIQSLNVRLLNCLLSEDEETNKRLFQLILESDKNLLT